jgi:hypothetical protein
LWWTSCIVGGLKRAAASVSGSYEIATRHGETRLKGGRMRKKIFVPEPDSEHISDHLRGAKGVNEMFARPT